MIDIRKLPPPDEWFVFWFETTCGWCEKCILPDLDALTCQATLITDKVAPGFEGQIVVFRVPEEGKRVALRVVDKKGHHLEYMACSDECKRELQSAIQNFYESWGVNVTV